jgi:hypothetical protein
LSRPKNIPAIALGADDVIPSGRCPVCGGANFAKYAELAFHEITIP